MKEAVKWGISFGILQAAITLFVSLRFSSPEIAIVSCLGLVLSAVLSLTCGLVATLRGGNFRVGLTAGVIATGIDTLSGLFGSALNPAVLDLGLTVNLLSYFFSIAVGIALSAAGAGFGAALYHSRVKAAPRP